MVVGDNKSTTTKNADKLLVMSIAMHMRRYGTARGTSPDGAHPGLHFKPLDVASGRVPVPYCSGGRHGHRFWDKCNVIKSCVQLGLNMTLLFWQRDWHSARCTRQTPLTRVSADSLSRIPPGDVLASLRFLPPEKLQCCKCPGGNSRIHSEGLLGGRFVLEKVPKKGHEGPLAGARGNTAHFKILIMATALPSHFSSSHCGFSLTHGGIWPSWSKLTLPK